MKISGIVKINPDGSYTPVEKEIDMQTRINTLPIIYEFEDEIEKLGGKLSDLPRYETPTTQRAIVTFPNGYGIDFVVGFGSYGLEAAIITHDDDDWDICYDSPITDDVLGYLNLDDVSKLLKRVSELEKTKQ